MSDSELLLIKNKRKASYKSRKTARSNLKIIIRPNDRFGFKQKNGEGRNVRFMVLILGFNIWWGITCLVAKLIVRKTNCKSTPP